MGAGTLFNSTDRMLGQIVRILDAGQPQQPLLYAIDAIARGGDDTDTAQTVTALRQVHAAIDLVRAFADPASSGGMIDLASNIERFVLALQHHLRVVRAAPPVVRATTLRIAPPLSVHPARALYRASTNLLLCAVEHGCSSGGIILRSEQETWMIQIWADVHPWEHGPGADIYAEEVVRLQPWGAALHILRQDQPGFAARSSVQIRMPLLSKDAA